MPSPRKYRQAKKKPSRIVSAIIYFKWPLVGIGLLAAFFAFFFGSSAFDPESIRVEGAKRVKPEDIIVLLKPSFTERHFGIFSGNAFVFNRAAAAERITQFFPRIARVSFDLQSRSAALTVRVVERNEPAAVWCSRAQGIDACYHIDDAGIAFEEAISGEGALLLTVENRRSDEFKQIGDEVIDRETLLRLRTLAGLAKERAGLGISRITIAPPDELVAQSLEGITIFFVDSRDLSAQVAALEQVLKTQIPKEKLGSLEYIDLRVKERAYYKYW